MRTKPTNIFFLLVIILSLILFLARNKVISIYKDIILDNKDHSLSCSQLPNRIQVMKFYSEHQTIIREIESVNPNFIKVEIADYPECPNEKSDFIIWYSSHQDRITIQKIIEESDFKNIPYRLKNY